MLSEKYFLELLHKKNVSDQTKKIYLRNINKIKDDVNYKKSDYNFLLDTSNVIKQLEKKYSKSSSLKTHFISIYSLLKESDIDVKVKNIYKKKMEEYRDKNNYEIKENKPSKKENDNYINILDIQEKSKELLELIRKKTETTDLSDIDLSKIKNKRNINSLLKLISDFITLYYISHTPPTRLENFNVFFSEKILNNKTNFIHLDSFNATYYLNTFKNVKKIGPVKILFSRNLSKILNDYYSFLKNNNLGVSGKYYLFTTFLKMIPNFYDKSNSFGQYLKRLFKKYFNKPITINDLRHSYTTDLMMDTNYNSLSINEKEKLHQKLLHNKETGEQYFKLYEITSDQKYKKDIEYNDKENLMKILKKHGYNLVI